MNNIQSFEYTVGDRAIRAALTCASHKVSFSATCFGQKLSDINSQSV